MAVAYEETGRQKRAQQAASIPPEWRLKEIPPVTDVIDALDFIRKSDLLSPKELEITETTDANVLLESIASRKLSSVDVVTAFSKRAALAHQLTTCCTEMFFDEALQSAKALDKHLEETGKTIGPLHGLPVSIKDQFDVKGVDSSIGWVGLTGKPSTKDSYPAQIFRQLGAVLYVKSNIPQSMMMSDSYNHVFGQCVNPLNRNLISGGSSGGEGSLVSARASVLGLGSDIGGSIRIPAGLCGLYGLCPTFGRQPYQPKGTRQEIVRPVAGPLTSSLSTVETYMSALASAKPWELDPYVVPVPWRTELCTSSGKLRIGYVIDDGVVKVQPPAARAVREVVERLRAAGHEVFEWDASSHGYCYQLWEKAILSDGGEACRKLCEMSGEPLVQGMLVGTEKDLMTPSELHQLNLDKFEYEQTYLERWADANLDALIMPVTPWIGYKPWTWVKSHQYVGYTSIWNFVNYAALTIPVTTVDVQKDQPDQEWLAHTPRNPSDEFNWKQYDLELIKGMPVGVQVVGGKFGDEKTIAVGKVIKELLK
ncbi:hypothetical protein PV04_00745 [Phialophora macrospora]|uniref:amidase n=1 Tax=Phialophora macrospora TaxID=1851006 RepID=A0A0D2FVT4_9EURO|nr:hypothetical protein PV04_00745 [Phialophora macrospora]